MNQRPAWTIASFIYNIIAGLIDLVMLGFPMIVVAAMGMDVLLKVAFLFPAGAPGNPRSLITVFLLLGIIYVIIGIARLTALYGFWQQQSWARTLIVVFHGIASLVGIIDIVIIVWWFGNIGLITTGMAYALIPLLFFALNVMFIVGLLLQQSPTHPPTRAYTPPVSPSPLPAPPQAGPTVTPPTQVATNPAPSGGYGIGGIAKTELANPDPPMLAWLIEIGGIRDKREHRLKEQVTIGRDPAKCNIILDDSKISGEHARIRMEQGQFTLYDLASTNHTYVNDQEIQKHILRDGDEIRLGTTSRLKFMRVSK